MRKLQISVFASIVIIAGSLYADSMKRYAENITITHVSPTGGDGYYSGGSYKMNFPTMTVNPINIKAPSFKAGCGGIDLAFGSIQFLDADKIVQFLEATLSNAAGVAFDLALKAACEECSETLKSLESMANAINNMALDSCQAATALVSATGLGQQEQTKSEATNWIKTTADNVTKFFDSKVNPWLNGLGANAPRIVRFLKKDQNTYSSLLYYLIGKDTSNPLNEEENFLRSISGEIVLYSRPSGENYGTFGATVPSKDDIDKLLTWRLGSKESENLSVKLLDRSGDPTVAVNSDMQLLPVFEPKVRKVADNINTRTAHSSDDLKFLSGFRTPVYKIFNALSRSPETRSIATEVSSQIAEVLAAQAMYEYISNYHYLLLKEKSSYDSLSKEAKASLAYDDPQIKEHQIGHNLELMIENVSYALQKCVKMKIAADLNFAKKLNSYAESINAANSIKNAVMMKRNPDFYNNLQTMTALSKTATP